MNKLKKKLFRIYRRRISEDFILLTNTSQIVGDQSQSLWASTVKRSMDIEAMMTAAAIIGETFVDIHGQ